MVYEEVSQNKTFAEACAQGYIDYYNYCLFDNYNIIIISLIDYHGKGRGKNSFIHTPSPKKPSQLLLGFNGGLL